MSFLNVNDYNPIFNLRAKTREWHCMASVESPIEIVFLYLQRPLVCPSPGFSARLLAHPVRLLSFFIVIPIVPKDEDFDVLKCFDSFSLKLTESHHLKIGQNSQKEKRVFQPSVFRAFADSFSIFSANFQILKVSRLQSPNLFMEDLHTHQQIFHSCF